MLITQADMRAIKNGWATWEEVLEGRAQPLPGTELKGMLAALGIKTGPNCKCVRRARRMDIRGPEWCREHLDEIAGWLTQSWPLRIGAKWLVKLAIKRSELRPQRP